MAANESFDKRVYVRDLKDVFDLRQISGNDDSLNRWIIVPDVNRPGLELSGYTRSNDLKRVNILGNKELEYLEDIKDDPDLIDRYNTITDGYTPCIVISDNNECPSLLLEIAQRKNFPIFISKEKTFRLVVQIIAFLDEKLAPNDTFHGVMMNIYGMGVMLKGESGIGKSELALELIKRGHILVSDDRADIYRVHNDLVCRAPKLLENMLELRGVGVIDVTLLYGTTSTIKQSNLDLIIELTPFISGEAKDRLGIEDRKTMNILGLDIPLMEIPVKEGRSMGVIIESAVANFRLINQGIDAAKLFKERVREAIEKKDKEMEGEK